MAPPGTSPRAGTRYNISHAGWAPAVIRCTPAGSGYGRASAKSACPHGNGAAADAGRLVGTANAAVAAAAGSPLRLGGALAGARSPAAGYGGKPWVRSPCASWRSSPLLVLVLPAVAQAPPLDPHTQPQFINPLPRPAVATPLPAAQSIDGVETYRLAMTEFQQHLGIYDPVTGAPLLTTVWGYGGSFPGPTIEARTGTPIKVWCENDLPPVHLLPVDPTLTLYATHTVSDAPCETLVVTHLH